MSSEESAPQIEDKFGNSNTIVDIIKKDIDNAEKTVPAMVFIKIGAYISKLIGKDHLKPTDKVISESTDQEEKPWLLNLLVLAFIVQLPTIILSNFLNEIEQWNILGKIWMGYIELGLSAMVIARLGVFYLFKNIKLYIIDAIDDEKDQKDLLKVLELSWSVKYTFWATLLFTVFWCISFSWIYTNIILDGKFIGWGLFAGTVVFGLLTGPALYMEGWFFYFIIHLGQYHYRLNETSPAHSEVIFRITRTLTFLLYSFAVFIAFSTVAVAVKPKIDSPKFDIGSILNIEPILLVALIGWIPTIVYFIGSQFSINRIIISAKWKTLSRIQNEISELHNSDITNKDNIEAINRLMEYHTRIRLTPDSTLSLGTGLNFVNQLALPFTGILLANIEKIWKIFSP